MRHMLAGLVIGVTLALTASAALAGADLDYCDRNSSKARCQIQPVQVSLPGSQAGTAGPASSVSHPYLEMRLGNIGH